VVTWIGKKALFRTRLLPWRGGAEATAVVITAEATIEPTAVKVESPEFPH